MVSASSFMPTNDTISKSMAEFVNIMTFGSLMDILDIVEASCNETAISQVPAQQLVANSIGIITSNGLVYESLLNLGTTENELSFHTLCWIFCLVESECSYYGVGIDNASQLHFCALLETKFVERMDDMADLEYVASAIQYQISCSIDVRAIVVGDGLNTTTIGRFPSLGEQNLAYIAPTEWYTNKTYVALLAAGGVCIIVMFISITIVVLRRRHKQLANQNKTVSRSTSIGGILSVMPSTLSNTARQRERPSRKGRRRQKRPNAMLSDIDLQREDENAFAALKRVPPLQQQNEQSCNHTDITSADVENSSSTESDVIVVRRSKRRKKKKLQCTTSHKKCVNETKCPHTPTADNIYDTDSSSHHLRLPSSKLITTVKEQNICIDNVHKEDVVFPCTIMETSENTSGRRRSKTAMSLRQKMAEARRKAASPTYFSKDKNADQSRQITLTEKISTDGNNEKNKQSEEDEVIRPRKASRWARSRANNAKRALDAAGTDSIDSDRPGIPNSQSWSHSRSHFQI
jgi:hypothetical protein